MMQLFLKSLLAATALGSISIITTAQADDSARTIRLHPAEGDAIALGTLSTGPDGTFSIDWEDNLFADHFLSMRPFKCLEGPEKLWCRAPYPYDNPRRIEGDDTTDLEYDLIVVWKGAGEYGIDMWNGVHYVLSETDEGFEGVLHEVNLDLLASPPESAGDILIRDVDLEEGDQDSHWLPRLTIE